MKKTYSLDEIREELFSEIDELLEKEPYWHKCDHCMNKGKCCIDNDIEIRDDEWERIKYLLDSTIDVRKQVMENLNLKRKCYFRTESCCLIHDIRPLNCIYTPYQVMQNLYDDHIYYSSIDEECNFETKEYRIKKQVPSRKILYLEKEKRYYLLLNHWYLKYEENSLNKDKDLAENRLIQYFKDRKD